MKILVTGRAIPTQPDRCTGQQLAAGFVQAGYDCMFYGNFYGDPYRWLGMEEATTHHFDLVVITEMNDGGEQYLLNTLNLKDVPRLYWDFDVSYSPNFAYQRAERYNPNAYLVANRDYLGKDGFGRFGKPVLHLPYACSSQIHRRKPEVLKQSIVGFVGSMTPERKALLQDVRCIEGVFGENLIDATNELYTMVHVNQNACKGLVPGRPWETAGCGTNLLMDRASYEDFKQFIPEYLDGTSVRSFDTPKDIAEYIQFYQDKPGSLREMGRMLGEYVHRQHTYKNRAEEIITWAKEQQILK